ncbi:histidine kinase N-terminal 7TM domain-containing protein [Cohnella panacarvi]|uniref:sensor histidine kinase n=1 Tax=Cohnella panacarvi TaxID=400776 RepID=UPI0004789CB6|nr:histidine kinase N-terminal 7TM domain-containing protein [Cohnella panacarvi]
MDIKLGMAVLLLMATALMMFVALLCYRNRHLPMAKSIVWTMTAASFYAIGYAFEVLGSTLGEVKLALQIEYVGIPFVSTLWLLQIIQLANIGGQYRKLLTVALFIVPTLVFVVHMTNDWHGLYFTQYELNLNGTIPLYDTVKGPWYTVHGLYSYLVMFFGMALFIPMYIQALPNVRKQIVILFLGAIAPMLFNMALWFGVTVDLTPFGFAITGITYAWGVLRFNLLRLTPLALAKVFETIGDGVVLLDSDERIVNYNQAAEAVLPELSLMRKQANAASEVLSAKPELIARLRAASSGDERFPIETQEANGRRYYSCSLSFLYDSTNEPIGKLLILSDITELKENEARLRENARQLSELNAFKDKLFTVVAHDIRDPIALLVSLTELLGDEIAAADNGQAELVRELRAQVQSTFHLVDNLLDWYRSQKGKVSFRPVSWNLRQVVRQAMSLAGKRADMKRIGMIERIDEKLSVFADKEMLELILRNLLSNAIKYTGIGGSIEIEAFPGQASVTVSVRDNGVGMDEATMELLRTEEPFFKLPMFEDESGDARFGLVLTREFVRIHGGRLWFESAPGAGTTFSFTLPASAGVREPSDTNGTEAMATENDLGGR